MPFEAMSPREPDSTPGATPSPQASPSVGHLSDPVPVDQVSNSHSYVLKDEHGRVLCVQHQGKWGWAYLGNDADYYQDVMPISATVQRPLGPVELSVSVNGQRWNLYASAKASGSSWVFASAQKWTGYEQLSLEMVAQDIGGQSFTLECGLAGRRLGLKAAEGAWHWLQLAGTEEQSTRFTLHHYYIHREKLPSLLKMTWPSATITLHGKSDFRYQAVSSHHAVQIWQDSELRRFRWREESFDCDDFAYVYKGQASVDAYRTHAKYGYALAWLSGKNSSGGHAVNLFLDINGQLKIIEPQTGDIVAAREWPYTPDYVIL